MLFPSVDQHIFSVGAGLREGNLILDAALLYSFGVKTEVSNNQIPSVSGSYNYDTIIPMVNLKYVLF